MCVHGTSTFWKRRTKGTVSNGPFYCNPTHFTILNPNPDTFSLKKSTLSILPALATVNSATPQPQPILPTANSATAQYHDHYNQNHNNCCSHCHTIITYKPVQFDRATSSNWLLSSIASSRFTIDCALTAHELTRNSE